MSAKSVALTTLGLPLLPVYWLADPAVREDAARWVAITSTGRDAIDLPPASWVAVLRMAARYPEFRSLLYRRANRTAAGKILARVSAVIYPGAPGLLLGSGPIGPGLYIEHGYSTVSAHGSIGRDVWLNQNVTLAAHGIKGGPIVGDRVRIHAGAIVLGGVTLADETVVGAGSVVSRDTEPATIVAGNPAAPVKARAGDGVRG